MTGKAKNKSVTLSPTIWIRCSKGHRRHVDRALRESPCLQWTRSTGFGEIMVSNAAELFASHSGQKPQCGDSCDSRLRVQIQKPQFASCATGLECRTTVAHGTTVLTQRYSRIGGVIAINGHRFGLTSGHGIVNCMLDAKQHRGPPCGRTGLAELNGEVSESDTDCDDYDDHEGESESNDIDADRYAEYAAYRLRPQASTPPDLLSRWSDCEPIVAAFGGLRTIGGEGGFCSPSSRDVNPSAPDQPNPDFALIDLGIASGEWANKYEIDDGSIIPIDSIALGEEIYRDSGRAGIILGPRQLVSGTLIPRLDGGLEICGLAIWTNVIRLTEPISKSALVIAHRPLSRFSNTLPLHRSGLIRGLGSS